MIIYLNKCILFPFKFTVGTRSARRGVYISLILTVLQQLCGFYTLLSYTTSFFEEAGSSLTPLQSSTLICVVQLVANISTMFLIDRLGRKILFISSSIGTGLGLLTLALHHLFKAELPECKWLPIYALSFTVFIAQAGLLSLPMIITIDVLPIKVSFSRKFHKEIHTPSNVIHYSLLDPKHNDDNRFVDHMGARIFHEHRLPLHARSNRIARMFDCTLHCMFHLRTLCTDFHPRNKGEIVWRGGRATRILNIHIFSIVSRLIIKMKIK